MPIEHSDCEEVAQAHFVLKGHRSIVNNVRYCPTTGLLASSGVEKIIKVAGFLTVDELDNSFENETFFTGLVSC